MSEKTASNADLAGMIDQMLRNKTENIIDQTSFILTFCAVSSNVSLLTHKPEPRPPSA